MRSLTTLLAWLCGLWCGWAQPQTGGSRGAEYTKADSTRVVALLQEARTQRGTENPVFYFGKKFLGLPYVAHTLELGEQEHLIVNLHELDCTTFVEMVVALALCDQQDQRTFDDFCRNLTSIRFRQGRLTDYTSRLHYFTWWAEDNEQLGIVSDICPAAAPWGAFTAVQTIHINYMSQHPALYKQLRLHPAFVAPIRQQEEATNGRRFRYIPKKNLAWGQQTALGAVRDGDIVAMLTDSDGLDTRHIGIAFWQDGQLHLLHASSLYKKVVMSKETFYEYEMKQPKHTGIRVFRVMEH